MCEFCDLKRDDSSGNYWWGKTGKRITRFALHQRIKITPNKKEYDSNPISLECDCDEILCELEINFCPMCGRKLNEPS